MDTPHAQVKDFFGELNTILAPGSSVTVLGEVAVLDETTGTVQSFENVTGGPRTITAVGSGSYSGASGACITWNTFGVRAGRRVRGRTFIVPLATSGYDSSGTLSSGAMGKLNYAAGHLVGSGADSAFGVFARPRNSAPGGFYEVTGHRIQDKVAVLSSRRD